MLSFSSGSGRFHLRAAAVVWDDGHLLLHRLEGDDFWALPGGRINMGERAADALVREFQEELGLHAICGSLLCVGENFFAYRGEPHHEVGLYFAATLPAHSFIMDKQRTHVGREGDRKLRFQWFLQSRLRQLDFRPAALQTQLAAGALMRNFVQQD